MGRPNEESIDDPNAAEVPTVPPPDEVAQLAKEAARLYGEVKDDEKLLKKKKDALDVVEFRLRARMEAGELKQVVTVDAAGKRTTMYLKACTYVGLLAEDREALQAWLKANGQGELVKETVNPSSLTAHVCDLLKQGGEVPPMVKVTHANEVRYNRG